MTKVAFDQMVKDFASLYLSGYDTKDHYSEVAVSNQANVWDAQFAIDFKPLKGSVAERKKLKHA